MAHMATLCALDNSVAAVETEEGEVQNDSDLIAGILAGYAIDDWFADTANIEGEGLRLEMGILEG